MKAYKTFGFILSVIILLSFLSLVFPEKGISVFGKSLYFPSIEDVLVSEEARATASEHLAEMERQMKMQVFRDSLNRQYQDSLNFYTHFFQNHPGKFYFPGDDPNFFSRLFEKLDKCKRNKEVVHILHYGDSQIEGDRITAAIRQKMQERFGGQGAGLIPAVQIIPTASIGQSYSGSIERYIISGMHVAKAGHRRYGALGQMGQMYGGASVAVASRNWKNTFENVKEFSVVKLYVGKADNFSASLSTGKQSIPPSSTENKAALNVFTWELDEPIKKFTLKMLGNAEIYGITVDGKSGVSVDNIPFRGSSGTFFSSIDSLSYSNMLEDLNTGLLILQFGGNSVPGTRSDKGVANYKSLISKQIQYLKRVYPQADVLLIGPADMSTKVNGKLQTYPYMEKFVQGMKEAAIENGATFWSMYHAMGGENSMIDWVKNSPSLAATDYIHFNTRGSERIAELFYESLMIYYDYHHLQKNHQKNLSFDQPNANNP